jgi:hypothetical protein
MLPDRIVRFPTVDIIISREGLGAAFFLVKKVNEINY